MLHLFCKQRCTHRLVVLAGSAVRALASIVVPRGKPMFGTYAVCLVNACSLICSVSRLLDCLCGVLYDLPMSLCLIGCLVHVVRVFALARGSPVILYLFGWVVHIYLKFK